MDVSRKTDELWRRYRSEAAQDVRNELLVQYAPLVRSVVLRMMPTYHGYNDFDDLCSCGVLGLIDAIDKFDPALEVKFETYASKRVRGEILDHMRKQDWAPSSLRRKINQIGQAFETMEVRLGRPVTEEEVADSLSIGVGDLRATLEKAHIFNLLYFEDYLTDSYNGMDLVRSEDDTPSESLDKKEMNRILADIIDELPRNEKTVVTLYYYEELTLKEIAKVLHVTESRVSQIHSKLLMKLRSKLGEALE